MSDGLRSFLLGTVVLDAALTAALLLTVLRPPREGGRALREPRLVRVLLLAIALQAVHFAEELVAGLHLRLPELLGLDPWPRPLFTGFNLAWLGIWLLAAAGLRRGVRAALFPAWFLAIAAAANGLLHPLLALRAGGYFPGLVSAPLCGVAGVLLLVGLARATGGTGAARPVA